MSRGDSLSSVLLLHHEADNHQLRPEVGPDHVSHPPVWETARHSPVPSYPPPLGLDILTEHYTELLHHVPVLECQLLLPEHFPKEFARLVTDGLPLVPALPRQGGLVVLHQGGTRHCQGYEGVPAGLPPE